MKKLVIRIILKLNRMHFIYIPDVLCIKLKYYLMIGKNINFNQIKSFNEKLQFLKLNDRKDIYTTMVDKYNVKKYVAEIIGNKYIIPTIGIYEKWNEINFEKLPNKFVLKCTHDSGGIVICKDKEKLNYIDARKKIKRCLKRNYYQIHREWPYKNVKPRILIEEYMEDEKTRELRDYKFFCFNGKVEFFKIDFNRSTNHRANYYNSKGELQVFGEEICPPDFSIKLELPINLKKMIELSEKLSKDIPFLRVDFYEVNGKVYFGELTFYPASGFGKFEPEEWDLKLGQMLDLSKVKNNEK